MYHREFSYRIIELKKKKTYNEYRCDKIAGARSTSAVAQSAQT